jgi:hypothetical protein
MDEVTMKHLMLQLELGEAQKEIARKNAVISHLRNYIVKIQRDLVALQKTEGGGASATPTSTSTRSSSSSCTALLREEILEYVLGFLCGEYLYVGTVCKKWRVSLLASSDPKAKQTSWRCGLESLPRLQMSGKPWEILDSVTKLSHNHNNQEQFLLAGEVAQNVPENSPLIRYCLTVGRLASIEVISHMLEMGLPRHEAICRGAAETRECDKKVIALVTQMDLPLSFEVVTSTIQNLSAGLSVRLKLLNWLKDAQAPGFEAQLGLLDFLTAAAFIGDVVVGDWLVNQCGAPVSLLGINIVQPIDEALKSGHHPFVLWLQSKGAS